MSNTTCTMMIPTDTLISPRYMCMLRARRRRSAHPVITRMCSLRAL
ncbi:hypothetical protein FOPG_19143 [Fusarium oxysporum f. sp. conglutinans race 2 54008]|uniref:Uncharacterized protein n=1 Tax=Fusarium oxysporum f. sp. conglutinans race 2 54008 TaxID=1089457 RepID=X0GXM8_FUSOX|nr:hypothetical protein FOPG_19143 [Fusarium oxysporum f. sp. conglutinans race 2 54008]